MPCDPHHPRPALCPAVVAEHRPSPPLRTVITATEEQIAAWDSERSLHGRRPQTAYHTGRHALHEPSRSPPMFLLLSRPPRSHVRWILLLALTCGGPTAADTDSPVPLEKRPTGPRHIPIDRSLPYGRAPIDYLSEHSVDRFRKILSALPDEAPHARDADQPAGHAVNTPRSDGTSPPGPERQTASRSAASRMSAVRTRLLGLLRLLDITPHSQLLVFSKTALHQDLVGPENPRAIYFNDHTFVGNRSRPG
ncbi:MAG: hypothetical protein D6725_09075 [Planctomycetota bacterium]|nr:MAG: hypothetical protein D6725_09075 [Planctomycetota bacterium]